MNSRSSMHFYLNWAKERIDEMDAMLASLEQNASGVQANARVKAEQLMADLHKRRDEFSGCLQETNRSGRGRLVARKGSIGNSVEFV